MSPSMDTTFPPDSELALYRAANDTDPAHTVNHISGGNLIPIPTGFPVSGTHSFVYGNRAGNTGRYPTPLRVGAVGEVCAMARSGMGSVISFCVRSPSAATPGAVCHQQATVSLLLYVLESEADQAGSSDVMGNWMEEDGVQSAMCYRINCTPYTEIIGEVNDGAVVSVEFTLHRYNHYTYGPVKREYNCVAHRIEVISESYLGNVGFVKEGGGCRDDLTDNDVTKVVDDFELMSVE